MITTNNVLEWNTTPEELRKIADDMEKDEKLAYTSKSYYSDYSGVYHMSLVIRRKLNGGA